MEEGTARRQTAWSRPQPCPGSGTSNQRSPVRQEFPARKAAPATAGVGFVHQNESSLADPLIPLPLPSFFWAPVYFFFLWQLSVFLISKRTCFELGFVFLFWVMGWYCFQLIQSHKYFHHIRTVYTFFYNEVVSLSLTAVCEHQREKIGNCSCRHTCMVTI